VTMSAANEPRQTTDMSAISAIPLLPQDVLESYVRSFVARGPEFLKAAGGSQTPVYLFDRNTLLAGTREFQEAFQSVIPDMKIFYAMKSNNYPGVAKTITQAGLGLDVSSGMELQIALSLENPHIIFSGPGKTSAELDLAAANADRVTVLLDSFSELDRLEYAAGREESLVRAGVRITTQEKGLWRKFGIPLSELHSFTQKAQACPHINLCGLQFHTSWNLDSAAQTAFIHSLGKRLRGLEPAIRRRFRFLDIGGGYWPTMGEWLQPSGTNQHDSQQELEALQPLKHHHMSAQPLSNFAHDISQALNHHIFPIMDCSIYAEPGRWLSNGAMHILLTVVDKKAPDVVVVDGGINLVGWERFETDYAPVINLSCPSTKEIACWIMGSLCTPHDLWGYSYFGQSIQPGDKLLVPDQGAYTYSLKQEFIKPIAPVVNI
jgi:diaminopimelate decarboxylase